MKLYQIVGHCPTCGAPIYGPALDDAIHIRVTVPFEGEPYSKFTCSCHRVEQSSGAVGDIADTPEFIRE